MVCHVPKKQRRFSGGRKTLEGVSLDRRSLGKIDASQLRTALMQKDRLGERRRTVTTKRGYVGMVIETVEVGDAIAVLLGCSMLIVLRKAESNGGQTKWRVVGECYIHGIMDGEAMEWGLEVQDIILC